MKRQTVEKYSAHALFSCSLASPTLFVPSLMSLSHVSSYFTFFFLHSGTSRLLLTTAFLPPLCSPPLTPRRMESWGEKSWRQARIISYICPHFLQKMIDLANYPMLPSLSHMTRGRSAMAEISGVCFGTHCSADAIWLFMSLESKERRKFQNLSWLCVDVDCFIMMYVLCLLSPFV